MNKTLLLALLIPYYCGAQETLNERYKAADNFNSKYSQLYYYGTSSIQPINNSSNFWYLTNTPNGSEFLLIDASKKEQREAMDQKRLAKSLSELTKKEIQAYKLPFKTIEFNEKMDSVSFVVDQSKYMCSLANYGIKKDEKYTSPADYYWGTVDRENRKDKVLSPDGKKEAYISEGNLWVKDLVTQKSKKLSKDGATNAYYSSHIYWSPDSKKIVCCKFRPVEVRQLLLIASSPADQLQPKTELYDYPKPGDALPVKQPVAFWVDEDKSVEFDVPDVNNQFSLDNIKWNKNNNSFTFNFNKRGHQQYVIYSADLNTGKLKPIVDEKSNTFVFYSNLYEYWFENSDELLWISERDGWRHLYLYDSKTGDVKKQLTSGDWIVKNIIKVDEKKRTLIFKACGMDKGEDPYLEKYYTLNIDNGKITCLTPENANHNVTFSKDFSYLVDNYSRADLVPTIVVRSTQDGKVVYKPKNQPDISKAIEDGWRMPEVFSAKGRDGITDIWGMIIRPTNFDPSKKYPIVEYIYAGPHDSHVPKSFSISQRCTELAELGFITVLIDGMGTANRSKAFHDVCWKNLKDAGFPDRIAWMKSANTKYPEMDIDRVGIYGGSAGGQNSTSALLFHPDFYKVAVSSCGCHDNRMDKIWWNEQWMGYPIGKEYEECSNVVNANKLQGKLMLILGELDNNVDPSSTMQVADELIKNDKEFELVIIPGARHTLGEKYGERKRRDFFVKHLLGEQTPEWNK